MRNKDIAADLGTDADNVVRGRKRRSLDEVEVKGEEGVAVRCCAQMQSVGEVQTTVHEIEGLGQQTRTFNRHAWQPRQCSQCGRDLMRGKVVDTAQHPFAFE